MSATATCWAINNMQGRNLRPGAKVVLWHLANFHGSWGCLPSQAKLSEACEISRATVNCHLNDLETAGLIYRLQRTDENGRQMTTRYVFAFEAER